MTNSASPCIVILGTGGTIAGRLNSPTDAIKKNDFSYTAAQISIDDLLNDIPQLNQQIKDANLRLESEQVLSCDSKDLNPEDWLSLARRCAYHLNRPQVQSIIVTHGTDTLEETAWALHRLLPHTNKPVILVSAMRPADAPDSDGAQNLLGAVTASLDPRLSGVLSFAAGELHSGMWVRKNHPSRISAFSSGEYGPLGWLEVGRLRLAYPNQLMHIKSSNQQSANNTQHGATQEINQSKAIQPLDESAVIQDWLPPSKYSDLLTADTTTLPASPNVVWLTSHAGFNAQLVKAAADCGFQGLLIAATGNGTLHNALEEAVKQVANQGCLVWLTTRCATGVVVKGSHSKKQPWAICPLPASKARTEMVLYLWQKQLNLNACVNSL